MFNTPKLSETVSWCPGVSILLMRPILFLLGFLNKDDPKFGGQFIGSRKNMKHPQQDAKEKMHRDPSERIHWTPVASTACGLCWLMLVHGLAMMAMSSFTCKSAHVRPILRQGRLQVTWPRHLDLKATFQLWFNVVASTLMVFDGCAGWYGNEMVMSPNWEPIER